ncbi:hypothetical protein GQ607_007728 [Colletotrichum asianum]|uniref:Uncharacterized protein n=1 Tax=Colletotrichum asianum TaxID=702518 RepID=A0A8H3WFY8_9PEZI|nr:hypothetical protein GQ607_007728 [Colletotrichum asianum]
MKTRRKKPMVVWLLAALISDVSFPDAMSATSILNNISLALKLLPYTDDSIVQLGPLLHTRLPQDWLYCVFEQETVASDLQSIPPSSFPTLCGGPAVSDLAVMTLFKQRYPMASRITDKNGIHCACEVECIQAKARSPLPLTTPPGPAYFYLHQSLCATNGGREKIGNISGVVAFRDCSYEGLTVLMVLHCFHTLLPVGSVPAVTIWGFYDHQVSKVRYPSWVKMDRFPRMRVNDEYYYQDDEVSDEA